jgi:zinc transport system permease protein
MHTPITPTTTDGRDVDFLALAFMRRALLAGSLIGIAAPSIGIFLVQRRLSLMGDGIGHVTFMGVAAGLLLAVSPLLTALVFAVAGASAIELLRQRGKIASDVALALIFYAGIAGGVLLLGVGDTSTINLFAWLFGSVLTVNTVDLWIISSIATAVTVTSMVLRKHLFAVAYDEESARVSGLPVTGLNLLVAVVAAVTVAVTAKIVGILLVSALLVLPVAAVQQVTSSFKSTFYWSMIVGVAVTISGLVVAFYADLFPSATIVLTSIGFFVVTTASRRFLLAR